jgi:phospholipase/lecithinase/hemolysin
MPTPHEIRFHLRSSAKLADGSDAVRRSEFTGDFPTLLAAQWGQAGHKMSFSRITCLLMLLALHLSTRHTLAAFTSMYVFGDGVCTMTNSPGGPEFYGNRFSNGRVWVEVLAQRQGITLPTNQNYSYFGHESTSLLKTITNFPAPADAATTLVVVWACDADFTFFATQFNAQLSQIALWTNAMNASLSNHFTAIQLLYNKGVRTLVMPNVVDLMKVPFFAGTPPAEKDFIRARIAQYNPAFAARLALARTAFPGLTIHAPDIHALLDDIVARPTDYGVINAQSGGLPVDALTDASLVDKSLNGPGANYIFWEYLDPTAKVHAILADTVQRLMSPPTIANVVQSGANNELQLVNMPIGLSGFVDGSTNFVNWSSVAGFNSSSAAQSVFIPANLPMQSQRLRFPFAWTWP